MGSLGKASLVSFSFSLLLSSLRLVLSAFSPPHCTAQSEEYRESFKLLRTIFIDVAPPHALLQCGYNKHREQRRPSELSLANRIANEIYIKQSFTVFWIFECFLVANPCCASVDRLQRTLQCLCNGGRHQKACKSKTIGQDK